MKLLVLLSVAALVACDYQAPEPEAVADGTPQKVDSVEKNVASINSGKPFFQFQSPYRGAFPPAAFPHKNFLSSATFPSFDYPLKAFNYAASSQGIFPPIVPPQISQIVPPISQVVPPIFGGTNPVFPTPAPVVPPIFGSTNPVFPTPAPVVPSQPFPPAVPKPLLNKFSSSFFRPLQYSSYAFPSTFSFPSATFYSSLFQKYPAKIHGEPTATCYGPSASAPASAPAEPEPAGPAETSASFEPAPVSYPYEPAVPEAQEEEAPHKPAQEYGLLPTQ